MLLRVPKMEGAIFGFQRCDWWPKCAPASSSWRMVKSGKAMKLVLVRLSLGGSITAKRTSPPERDLEQEPRQIRLWNGAAYMGAEAGTQAASAATGAIQSDAINRCGVVIFAGCCR